MGVFVLGFAELLIGLEFGELTGLGALLFADKFLRPFVTEA